MNKLNIDCSTTHSVDPVDSSEIEHLYVQFSNVDNSVLRLLNLGDLKDVTFVTMPPTTVESLIISNKLADKIMSNLDTLFPNLTELNVYPSYDSSVSRELTHELPSSLVIANLHNLKLSTKLLPNKLKHLTFSPVEEELNLPKSLSGLTLTEVDLDTVTIKSNLDKLTVIGDCDLNLLGIVINLEIDFCLVEKLKLNYPEHIRKLIIKLGMLDMVSECSNLEELHIADYNYQGKDLPVVDLSHFNKLTSINIPRHLSPIAVFPESLKYVNGSSVSSTITKSKFNKS